MASNIKIAVDAMGGDNSPKKIIDGILVNSKENKDVVYNIFGDKDKIELLFQKIIIKKFLLFLILKINFRYRLSFICCQKRQRY